MAPPTLVADPIPPKYVVEITLLPDENGVPMEYTHCSTDTITPLDTTGKDTGC
jgi:hypothetical protein